MSALFAAVVSASSPPTRGCSDAGRLPVLGEGVLPADAGVFRGAWTRPWPWPCPPRRRGVFRHA